MRFQIIADEKEGGSKSETRVYPGSAAVLAMKWLAEGARSVRIEADGRIYDVEEFRKAFMNGAQRNGSR
jgi:hypothetical protein